VSILDLIVVSSLSVLLVLLSALLVASKLKQRESLETMAQLLIDRAAMSEEINRLNYIVENSSDLNDGFIKFLSESREEAFSYISEVQQALEYIKIAMELKDDIMISDAYNKLISFLPNENPDVVN
jgi:c-di-GMP-related signal transduction protein